MAGFEREISQTLLSNKEVVLINKSSGMRKLEYRIAEK
jgi:hypothetical protein